MGSESHCSTTLFCPPLVLNCINDKTSPSAGAGLPALFTITEAIAPAFCAFSVFVLKLHGQFHARQVELQAPVDLDGARIDKLLIAEVPEKSMDAEAI